MTLLFVYGTLKRGGVNHRLLADQRHVGPACTGAGYRLYQLDGYPGMVVDQTAAAGIRGEIWEVGDDRLGELDAFEGVPENLYRRVRVKLAPPHDALSVETYLYAGSLAGRPPLGNEWPE